MHNSKYGILPRWNYTNLPERALSWFDFHYAPSPFHGRFQLGYRKKGETGIWPLFTGERESVEEFLMGMHMSSNLDYYITANAVKGVKRGSDQIFSLHNIVLDIDSHKDADEPPNQGQLEELFWRLNRDLFSSSDPPPPTSIIQTGRGLQLWWAIVPMAVNCVTWYKEIQDTLIQAINEFLDGYPDLKEDFCIDGAPSRNIAGYFRLPGTINTRTGTAVEILEFRELTYDTHDFIRWAKQWKEANKKDKPLPSPAADFSGQYLSSDMYILRNFHTTAFFRVRQLIQLRILRDNDVGEETRNNMCFIAYNAMLPAVGPQQAWEKLIAFNEGFKEPMSEKELHQTVDTSLKKGGYKYKNTSIIEFLGITSEEQEAIGLYAPSQPFSSLTRLSGHPARNASRKTQKDDRNRKIHEMAKAGVSREKIANELGISRNTVATVLGPAVSVKDKVVELLNQENMSTKEIALALGISQRTVQNYKKMEMRKDA